MLWYFWLGFAQVTLISIQSRNYAQGRYVLSAVGSLFISLFWWITVHSMATYDTTYLDGFGYILGNAAGGVLGIYLHKRFTTKKDVNDW